MARKRGGEERLIRVSHGGSRIREELELIVGLGGGVRDVIAEHKVYGRISAELEIGSERDIEDLIGQICSGESTPLMTVTSGEHFHHIWADSEETLDRIQEALGEKGFLPGRRPNRDLRKRK